MDALVVAGETVGPGGLSVSSNNNRTLVDERGTVDWRGPAGRWRKGPAQNLTPPCELDGTWSSISWPSNRPMGDAGWLLAIRTRRVH